MKRLVKIGVLLAILFVMLWVVATTTAQGEPTSVTLFPTSLRSAPSRWSNLLFSIPAKTVLQIEARNAGADWLLVHTSDMRRGWLMTRQLGFQKNPALNGLPVSSVTLGNAQAAQSPTQS